ncbi:MAG: thioredoxin domain-containing protein [Terracidiphilus sp.]|nr:thioredoxin domain-containing protein [Terracidiphilus sp.]
MPQSFSHTVRIRLNLLVALAFAAFVLAALPAYAQFGAPPTTQVHDASALRPPAGSRVAIVEFADMECPDCSNAFPLVRDAVAKYKIPLVYHDFPLPFHNWSFQAAVNARWFDLKSKKLGEDYRGYIFSNQRSIDTPAALANYTQTFAKSHGIAFPFAVDPQGKLSAAVKADYALGQRIGVEHTPTIWVVTAGSKGAPFIEILDRTKLYQILDQAIATTHGR